MAVDPARPELNSEAGPPETEARLLVHTRKEALKQLVMEHTGMRVTDAAHMLNVSVSTVKGRYRYGLQKLRSALNGRM